MSESRGADAAPRFNRTCPLGSVGCQVRVPHTLNSCFDSLLPQHGEQPLPPSEARTPGWLNKQFKRAAEDVTVLEAALDHRKAEPSSPRPALRDYVQHKPGCAYLAWMRGVEYNEQPCSCGLAALLDAERGEGWQPIESGPKDGTPVLLWWPHHASRALIGVCHFDHWSSEGANGCQRVQPTHWMPLPKGPNHAA
jgi:hypothetical protein